MRAVPDVNGVWNPEEGTAQAEHVLWPGTATPVEGCGVAGRVEEYGHFIKKGTNGQPDERVNTVTIVHAIAFEPTSEAGGVLVDVGAVKLFIGVSLDRVLTPVRIPAGTLISVTYKGTKQFGTNTMKDYAVATVTRAYMKRLHEVVSGVSE